MGIVLDEPVVYTVFTEVNGYRNVYGHSVFSRREDAEAEKDRAIESGKFDDVRVLGWRVV